MERSESINRYLDEVLTQVRWKKAHSSIRRELADHIEDETRTHLDAGLSEELAQQQALLEMGNAVDVGAQFNSAYRPQAQRYLWVLFGLLLLAGIAFRGYLNGQLSLSPYIPLFVGGFALPFIFPMQNLPSWTSALQPAKKRIPVLLSIFAALLCGLLLFDLSESPFIFIPLSISLILAAVVAVSGLIGWVEVTYALYCVSLLILVSFSARINGSVINADYFMLFLPVIYALLIYRMRGARFGGILLLGVSFLLPASLALLMPSLVALLLVSVICIALLLYAIQAGWFSCNKAAAALTVVLPVIVTIVVFVIMSPAYRISRLQAMLFPETDPANVGYMGNIAKEILAKSSLFGAINPASLSASTAAELTHKGALTHDFLLSWLCGRLGNATLYAVALLVATFVVLAARACLQQRSMLGRLLCLSIVLTFSAQCAGYIAGSFGVSLFLRYPLPFISTGNTAMLANSILFGMLMALLRSGPLLYDSPKQPRARWKLKLVQEA